MDYELARELKEAGFPAEIRWTCERLDHNCAADRQHCRYVVTEGPTLDAVLDQCGLNFMLSRYPDSWRASDGNEVSVTGAPPLAAAAHFWVASRFSKRESANDLY